MRQTFPFRAAAGIVLLAACAAIAACSKPKAPDHDNPPEPQAAATVATTAPPPTALREAMREPIDKAQSAQADIDAAAERQRASIDAATGG